MAELTPGLREDMRIDPKVQGVVVTGVASNSEAAGTGLRPGDVVLSINGKPTRTIDDFKRVVAGLKGMKMSISLYRQGAVMNLTIIR